MVYVVSRGRMPNPTKDPNHIVKAHALHREVEPMPSRVPSFPLPVENPLAGSYVIRM
jgi:hypothetical protein